MLERTATVIIVALAALALPACNRAEKERQAAREELDHEFEEKTEQVKKEAAKLSALLDELVADHEKLDQRHAELDALLAGAELDDEARAMQDKHAQWEEGHAFLMEQARAELARFEQAHEQHELDEATHADASLEQLREDHERFERELVEIEAELAERVHELELARRQMEIIFTDHEALNAKYGR